MSYKSQGVGGLIVGILILVVLLGVGRISFLAIGIIVFSVIALAWGSDNIAPGSLPRRCGTWGHDWRAQLPGLPSGTTCRNCLLRKDKAVLAWRQFVPPGVEAVIITWAGLIVPVNAAKAAAKRAPKAFLLVEYPGFPRLPLTPGVPLQLPAMPVAVPVPGAPVPGHPTAIPGFSAPPGRPAANASNEALCKKCFAVIPPGALSCPNCRAPRP